MKKTRDSMMYGACVAAVLTAMSSVADTVTNDYDYGNADAAYLGKDAAIGLYATHGNLGAGTDIRAGKPGGYDNLENFAIYGWNCANIVTSLDARARANGWTGLQDAYDRGKIQVALALRPVDDPTNGWAGTKTLRIGFFDSETAWVEGNGSVHQDFNYSWATNTAACTDAYAVDWRPGDDLAQTPTKWRDKGVDHNNLYELSIQYNTQVFTNLIQNQYNYVTLDATLWWNYLHSTNSGPGLITRDNVTGGNPNMRVNAKESGVNTCPRLRATIVKHATSGTLLMFRP